MARVLVVEDNPVTRKMFRVTLQREGFEVLESATGGNALDVAGRERPDLVITDLQLLDMDGVELVKRLRLLPSCAAVPVIAVSGSLGRIDEIRRGGHVPGAVAALLTKPVEPAALVAEVRARLAPGR